jgi:1-acyl-sn-glycerol-3-phosphate acyltransferase
MHIVVDALDALLEVFGPQLDPDLDNLDNRIASWAIPAYGVVQSYFRAKVHGLERIPAGKALMVGNHNSGITFLEPIILGREWLRFTGGPDALRFLVHDAMVKIPVLGNLLMKSGAVRASREAVSQAFEAGHKILVFPGGNIEAFRPWKDRHKIVFRGHKGFARMALLHGTPIVPVMNLGGHNTFMVLWRGEPLAKLTRTDKFLRSPSFPLFLGLPWGIGLGPIFHFPLPAKMTIEIGEPIPVDGYGPDAVNDQAAVDELYEQTVAQLQAMMDRHVGR